MGQPLLVLDLVRTLIKLSGRNEKQVTIQFTGLRQGEKLIEELFHENEEVDETSFPNIKRVRGPIRDWDLLLRKLEELEASLFSNDPGEIRSKIKEILPEYSYLSRDESKANVEEEFWSTTVKRGVA
jgi:FlaA1/EpsC-like NDP-sugar epimerase